MLYKAEERKESLELMFVFLMNGAQTIESEDERFHI